MTDHPHAARYRAASAAMADGDFGPLADLVADDVEWWEIGATEPIRGKAALAQRMTEFEEDEENKYIIHAELHDVVANGEHLIALVNATASRNGESFSYRTAEIHHVDDAGNITQRWAFSDDTNAITTFFG